ncbi:conserved Plasmodium protein, unknown function [Plasmodium knowlesi strain H]|uniref:Uncharacterized protein n=3 Tax=Plasmodium knowlesi TaxID=5850 RepID=A0A5K1U4V9_PLAKH|nr:conserved Plasmodium protein, unknown function [Plasmodium knowlesi strain H]OTN66230.1 Uncharacterized protein PKNOH_S09531400 [Plasmodium knowlesi]CAA9989993.1 conserved Plasmodium protein, unknown function [Plasmodium knowlesi strain H]SBO24587.1 conserved Plasmodium protein, unknown function [Plasmodium knowlesi strain H]SBO26273.1 conserved Plasmodium protein, unknown function [Plasmodium knowlesi strain H]VVS79467.1 conserved Plasmodium protein, unknown function [Plasmodium knowlesi s|eukprot:XP_002260008.1 hypothetical protein, conserved in Plasmodium species [Plasmodium knowlesi strain H]
MGPPSEDTCCYCFGSTGGKPYHHVMWKSYKMCVQCKTNLKNCFSCERKIKEKISSRRCTPCCKSTYDNLCDICCELPIICCHKKVGDVIPEILYLLDLYMGIRVPPNFMTYQNIYTFNKEKFNDANHRFTFEYDHIGYAQSGESTKLNEVSAPGGDSPRNGENDKLIGGGDYKTEQNQKRDIKTLLRKLTRSRHGPKKRRKKKDIIKQTDEEAQRVNFSTPPKNNNSENNKVEGRYGGGHPLMSIAKERKENYTDSVSPHRKLPPTEDKNHINEKQERRRERKFHKLKKLVSTKSSLYNKATAPLLEYIKLLRSRKKESGKDRRGRISLQKTGATEEGEEKNNTTPDMEKKKKTRISTRISTRIDSKAATPEASQTVSKTTSKTAFKTASRTASRTAFKTAFKTATATARKSYHLDLVLSFSNQMKEEEIFTRLLHNELKCTDVLYLRNMLKHNEDGERTIASCNCVIVSQKKLLLLHEQNKMIHNYVYRNLELTEILPQNNEHIKLVDHVSLANSLPDISFYFYMSHELMHTYLWVSHLDTSVHFEKIKKIVKKLHMRSFHIESQNKRGGKFHKSLAYYLSPELEEALCVFASVQFMHHVREVNVGECERGHSYNFEDQSIHDRECELINYYIRTCERGGSPMYGKNYRELKRIMKNYTLVDILQIIGDIRRARFYPMVTLRLLRAVISFIRVVS